MNNLIIVFLLFSATFLGSASADQLDTEICKTVLESGIRSTYSVYTDQEKYDYYKARLCRVDFDQYDSYSSTVKSRGLSIETADALLGLSGNRNDRRSNFQQKYRKYCQSDLSDSEFRSRFSSRVSRIETALASSFNRCIRNHLDVYLATEKQGIYIYVTPQRDFATFNVRVERNRNVVPDDITISNFVPDGEVICTRNGKIIDPGESIRLNKFSMTCRKDPEAAVSFAIETAGEGVSNEVFLPESKDTIYQLEVKVEQLTALILDLAPLGRVSAFNRKECPSGWKEYAPAYGRFIRGIDRSGSHFDPDGLRIIGTLQDYSTALPRTAFTGKTTTTGIHHHDSTGRTPFRTKYGNNDSREARGKGSNDGGHSHGIIITSGGDAETRPSNVALLYCEKQ